MEESNGRKQWKKGNISGREVWGIAQYIPHMDEPGKHDAEYCRIKFQKSVSKTYTFLNPKD